MNKGFKVALLSTVFSSAIFASNSVQASNEYNLNTVTVVATKTEQNVKDIPAQVNVIDADDAEHGTVSRLSDLLRNVPGVEFSGGPRRNGEEIKIRGYDSENIIITVDGKRQNFNSAHDGRFFLDPSLVKRVDIVKGPSSAIYGAGGIGGVIAFATKDAKDFLKAGETEGAESFVGYQSASEEFLLGTTAYKRTENFDAVASIVTRNSDNIELGNGSEIESDDKIYSGFAKLTYFIDDESSIKFDYQGYFGNSIEPNNPQSSPSTATNINTVDKDNTVHQIGAEYKLNTGNAVDLTARAYFVDTEVEEIGDQLVRNVKTFGFTLDNISRIDDKNTLTYGFEVVNDRQEGIDTSRTTRNGVPNAESLLFGAFIQNEIKIDDIFNNGESELYITPAIRYDEYRNSAASSALDVDHDEAVSPKIAANLKINNNLNFFGSWAEAFRAPTLTELYAQGTHFPIFGPFVNSFVANPNLRPENSETTEIGFGYNLDSVIEDGDKLSFKASRYWTEADDYIEQDITLPNIGVPFVCPFPFTSIACSGGTTQFTNVEQAKIWGYEASLSYAGSVGNMTLGAAYVTGKNELTGEYLDSIHPLIVTADFNRKWEEIDSIIGYNVKIAAPRDKVNPSSDDQFVQNDYVVHNLYVRYQPENNENITLDFGVDNILDKTYAETFAGNFETGRNIKVRLTYKW